VKILIIFTILFLTGCAVVPVDRKFPEAPKQLMVPCQELSLINPDENKMSGVLTVVVENYTKYHECSIKVDSWIDWYNQQKKNFDEVK
jgi:hypothetical protein